LNGRTHVSRPAAGFAILFLASVLVTPLLFAGEAPHLPPNLAAYESDVLATYGDEAVARLRKGFVQLRSLWRPADGDSIAMEAFVRDEFIADQEALDKAFHRIEAAIESTDGHFLEISRDLRRPVDLDLGPLFRIDAKLAAWSPSAHLADDWFDDKIAFWVLLNFPLATLDEKLTGGPSWSRRRWAETRLAERFSRRVPADVAQEISTAFSKADSYISSYDIHMNHLLTPKGERLFREGLKLITHWGLRDELKAAYAEGKNGLAKQRMIALVMEKIVRQEIPAAVVGDGTVDWTPETGAVVIAPGAQRKAPSADREPDTRYARLLDVFHAVRKADPHSPALPTYMARRFEEDREIPEKEVAKLFERLLGSPAIPKIGRIIEKRLGRKLEPFDIWYNGFLPRGTYTEEELDRITKKKYPDVAAFQAALPEILRKLGFAADTADFVASKVVVDPSRGAGHAMGAERRADSAHLRTRIGPDGMAYKGYSIAVHEFGHNVEQVFSLNRNDEFFLKGVPNTAFTEALAFVFQSRDLELLGLAPPPSEESKNLRALSELWAVWEIAGVSSVDMAVWHWMYEHPEATPAELRETTVRISKEVWNRWYAPVFGKKDAVLLGIYSHMIDAGLYLPDYALGHLISFQTERYLEGKSLATEVERICRQGRLTPDLWMKQATGAPISVDPIEKAALEAIAWMEKGAKKK
jgi:hypothetical protein